MKSHQLQEWLRIYRLSPEKEAEPKTQSAGELSFRRTIHPASLPDCLFQIFLSFAPEDILSTKSSN